MKVIALAVTSLDGCLTRHDEPGVSFSSPEDQAHFRRVMRDCGATIMGRRTFDTVRDRILAAPASGLCRTVMTRDPAAYADVEHPGALEFTAASPREIVSSLSARGFEAVAVLGGGEIFDLFVADALLTEWRITVEPRLFGTGTRLLSRPTDRHLRLTGHRLLNESTLLLTYSAR